MASADRFLLLMLVLVVLHFPACIPPRSPSSLPQPCKPRCMAQQRCDELDASLVLVRQPLLQCIGQQAHRGHLAQAHRCYRSLRLLESARWWLKTVISQGTADSVYQNAETTRQEFLCKIEQLARSRTPEEVEHIYMEIIRAFP